MPRPHLLWYFLLVSNEINMLEDSVTGCPHIYRDEKSRQNQEYQEEFSGNIKTFNWNHFINSLGKHTLTSYQYDFLHQSQHFVIVAAETKLILKTGKHNFHNSNN